MKKIYESPKFALVMFDDSDIITSSNNGTYENGDETNDYETDNNWWE